MYKVLKEGANFHWLNGLVKLKRKCSRYKKFHISFRWCIKEVGVGGDKSPGRLIANRREQCSNYFPSFRPRDKMEAGMGSQPRNTRSTQTPGGRHVTDWAAPGASVKLFWFTPFVISGSRPVRGAISL